MSKNVWESKKSLLFIYVYLHVFIYGIEYNTYICICKVKIATISHSTIGWIIMSIWFFYEPVVKNGDLLNLTNLWKFNIQYAVRLAGQICVQTPCYPIWDLSNQYTNLMAKHHSNFVLKQTQFLAAPLLRSPKLWSIPYPMLFALIIDWKAICQKNICQRHQVCVIVVIVTVVVVLTKNMICHIVTDCCAWKTAVAVNFQQLATPKRRHSCVKRNGTFPCFRILRMNRPRLTRWIPP